MAGRSVWGIDLGQCALKAIKLTYDSKTDRAVAVAFDYIEHPKILSQPDADPEELTRSALEKFLSRNDVKDDQVYISVPGQAGLARFVTLPPVESKKIPNIVMFEARQQIPFPLEDVVWDFQKIGGGEEEAGFALETEVGIFAIKRDMVQRSLQPFTDMGMEVDVVQLAPVALYNFTAFDYFFHAHSAATIEAAPADAEPGEEKPADAEAAAAKSEPEGEEGEEGDTVVILDIGADKTDVVITDGDSIWLRNLPIGGNHFTRALTKELKLTFAKAEHLKRNATKAPDPKKLYQAMRPVFQDFVSELQRSIGYFSSTHRDRVVKKVIGVGNGFKLPGLQKFLQQNLQYDVEKVNNFKGVDGDEVLKQPAFSENLLSFCVAYGLAMQGLEQTPVQTNLLPREIQSARMIRAKKPWALTAAAALLFGFMSLFVGNWRILSAVESPAFKGPEANAKSAVDQFRKWNTEYDGAVGKFKSTLESGETLLGVSEAKGRLDWIKVFAAINRVVPRAPVKQGEPEVELESIKEVNIEYIDAAFFPDVGVWFGQLDENTKNTMVAKDKETPPSGEGWVFQVLGYTFNEDHQIFVQNEILTRFQAESLRKEGVSHALLSFSEVDQAWTPSKGSPLAKLPKMVDIAVKARGAGAGGSPQGGMPGGGPGAGGMDTAMTGMAGMEPGMGGMAGMEGMGGMPGMGMGGMPEDFQAYDQLSTKMREQSQEAQALMRTDFAIQFVWVPSRPAAESAEPPANP